MPFVTQEHRDNPDPKIPGDRCFRWYKYFMYEWKEEPRWTTVDRLYYTVKKDETTREEQIAKELAWQVWFILHAMPYEELKMEENGDIE